MAPAVPDIGRYVCSWTDVVATNIVHNTKYNIYTTVLAVTAASQVFLDGYKKVFMPDMEYIPFLLLFSSKTKVSAKF